VGRQLAIGLVAATVAALAGCLDAPARDEPAVGPDAGAGTDPRPIGGDAGDGTSLQPCSVSVTYASEFLVSPGHVLIVHGLVVLGNAGDAPLDIGDLHVGGISTQATDVELTVDLEVSPDVLPPREAHGELDDDVIAEVASALWETWTDDGTPTLKVIFDPDDAFATASAVVSLALGDVVIPLAITFVANPDDENRVVRSERLVVPCPG
jgi:hypothetical protein